MFGTKTATQVGSARSGGPRASGGVHSPQHTPWSVEGADGDGWRPSGGVGGPAEQLAHASLQTVKAPAATKRSVTAAAVKKVAKAAPAKKASGTQRAGGAGYRVYKGERGSLMAVGCPRAAMEAGRRPGGLLGLPYLTPDIWPW